MKKIILFLMLLIFIAGCADVTNIDACTTQEPYGFFGGLWHGMISLISFIVSLFSDEVTMYAVNNNGGWYDFGFVLGCSMSGFGIGKSS
jgi:hypothetical protein